MDVRSFKLSTGEELVAQFVSANGVNGAVTGYVIKTPLVVHMMRTPEGPSLAFGQWSMVQKQDVEITLFAHALMSEPVELLGEVADSYIQQVTGLVLPPSEKKILLG